MNRQFPLPLAAFAAGVLLLPVATSAENPTATGSVDPEAGADTEPAAAESRPDFLPAAVTEDHFTALREHSPFLRSLDLSGSLVLTGIARIEDEMVATVLDLQTGRSHTLSEGKPSFEGWQLMEVKGEPSDFESLIAKVKMVGAEIVTIRYEKTPPTMKYGGSGVAVSTRVGNGTPGGGTGPHGGPDPRVLTPDQLADARKGARDIRAGFQADGYGDNQAIPPEVVSKLSRLSTQQRESINVKMYEYRNRGLGMPERQKIYNKLLDSELQRR